MEAIGEQLDGPFGGLFGGNADDADSRVVSPARLRAVPGGEGSSPDGSRLDGSSPRWPVPAAENPAAKLSAPPPIPRTPATLGELAEELATAALAAPGILATATYLEAADYAGHAEELARTVEYLQLLAAGAVDRTRTQAITQAAARTTHPAVPSPADDGCRNTAEFLRLRLRIPIREARRRLTLAQHTLPRTSLTGQPLPPTRPHLATALTPHPATDGTTTQPPTGSLQAPAVSSYAATLITATLDRLQHHTTPDTLDRIEHHLTTAATSTDPDFLTRLAQRWTDTIDADGTEPTEEALRHTQGAFIRKPRHGLHHLEIFATTDQYEHLLTVMNTATNPRTTTPNTSTGTTTPTTGTGTIPTANNATDHTARPAPPDLDRRTRAQKQLDGIITATKTALATNTLPTAGGNNPKSSPPSTTGTSSPPTPQQQRQENGREYPHHEGHRQAQGQRQGLSRSPDPSPPPPCAKSPATPTSSPRSWAPTAKSSTSAAKPASSPPPNAPPSPPATKAAPSPTAPSPHPGAKPTTSPTGHTADPPPSTTASCSAATTTTSSTKNNGPSPPPTTPQPSSPHPTSTPSKNPNKTTTSNHHHPNPKTNR